MRVEVTKAWLETPEKICLEWSTDFDDSDVFKSRLLTITYDEEVPLNAGLATFIFINTILACYSKYYKREVIDYVLPAELSYSVETSIKQYHNIEFSSECSKVLSIEEKLATTDIEYENALFYGGGKDSLVSALIQKELYGASNIVLLRLVWDTDVNNLPIKRSIIEKPLNYMREIGIESKLIESNFHNIITNRHIGKLPNLALYPGLMMPILSKLNVKRVVNGYDPGLFHLPVLNKAGEKKLMPFSTARPEQLKILAESIEGMLKQKIYFRNYNYAINENIAFELLSKAFQEHWANIYMCERLVGKWCLKCRKCFLYAIACLAFEMESDFNLGYFFQTSKYIQDLVYELKSLDIESYSQPPYFDKFSAPTHFCVTIRLVNYINLDYAKSKIDHEKYNEAYNNFLDIIKTYKKDLFTDYDYFWMAAYEYDLLTSEDPNLKSERLKMLELLDNSRVGISYKRKFLGLNRDRDVLYDYS